MGWGHWKRRQQHPAGQGVLLRGLGGPCSGRLRQAPTDAKEVVGLPAATCRQWHYSMVCHRVPAQGDGHWLMGSAARGQAMISDADARCGCWLLCSCHQTQASRQTPSRAPGKETQAAAVCAGTQHSTSSNVTPHLGQTPVGVLVHAAEAAVSHHAN